MQVDVRTRAVSPFPGGERFLYPKCSAQGDILAGEWEPGTTGTPASSGCSTPRDAPGSPGAAARPYSTRAGRATGDRSSGSTSSTNRIERWRRDTGQVEPVADVEGIPLFVFMDVPWVGLDADDRPLVTADRSTRDIYSLDWEAP